MCPLQIPPNSQKIHQRSHLRKLYMYPVRLYTIKNMVYSLGPDSQNAILKHNLRVLLKRSVYTFICIVLMK